MKRKQHNAHVTTYLRYKYETETSIFWKWAMDTGFANLLVA